MRNNIMCKAIKILREEGIKAFSKKTQIYLTRKVELFALPYSLIKIKRLNCNLTLDELVDFAFNDCAGLIKPYQVRSEIVEFLKLIERMKPKIILEIGTFNGGTLFLFTRTSSEDATIISIDSKGKFDGGYSRWRKPLYRSFLFSNQKIHLLRMDSHKGATLRQVKGILGNEKCDLLFIDGDHTYDGVKRDFEMYSPLTRKGGIIAFHDIVPGPIENVGGVPQFWGEIKKLYKREEIVEDWEQGSAGIGLIEFK